MSHDKEISYWSFVYIFIAFIQLTEEAQNSYIYGCKFSSLKIGIGKERQFTKQFDTVNKCIQACVDEGGNGVTIPDRTDTLPVDYCICYVPQTGQRSASYWKNCLLSVDKCTPNPCNNDGKNAI